jgi:hypothetical protein
MSNTYKIKLESIDDDVVAVFPDDFVAKHNLVEGDILLIEDEKETSALTLSIPKFNNKSSK